MRHIPKDYIFCFINLSAHQKMNRYEKYGIDIQQNITGKTDEVMKKNQGNGQTLASFTSLAILV